MKKLGAAGPHDAGGNLGGIGFNDEAAEFGNALPIAIIVEEAARFAGPGVFRTVRAGIFHIGGDAGFQQRQPGPE